MDCSARGKPVRRTMVACCLHRVVEQENVTVQSSVRRMTPEPVVILTFEVVKGRISLCSQVFPGARGVGVDADAPRFLFYALSPDCAECGLCGLRQEPSAPKQVAHVPCSAASRLSDCAATGLWVSAEEGRSGDKVGAGVAVLDDWIDARMARELRAGVVLDMDGY